MDSIELLSRKLQDEFNDRTFLSTDNHYQIVLEHYCSQLGCSPI